MNQKITHFNLTMKLTEMNEFGIGSERINERIKRRISRIIREELT